MGTCISLLSGLLIKSGSESSLSEEDESKRGDSGKKEAQAQGEEKESCSDEEKNKENIDAEGEQCIETGMTVKTHSDRRIIDTVTNSEHELHFPGLIQFPSTASQSISLRFIVILSCCLHIKFCNHNFVHFSV
jgi:hypothetical protein